MSGFARVLWLCGCVKYGLECQSTLVSVHFVLILSQYGHLLTAKMLTFFNTNLSLSCNFELSDFHAFNCYYIFHAVDTPDPYVKLSIPTSSYGFRKTKTKSNTTDSVWNEVFSFYLDPTLTNVLGKSELD